MLPSMLGSGDSEELCLSNSHDRAESCHGVISMSVSVTGAAGPKNKGERVKKQSKPWKVGQHTHRNAGCAVDPQTFTRLCCNAPARALCERPDGGHACSLLMQAPC